MKINLEIVIGALFLYISVLMVMLVMTFMEAISS